MSGGLLKISGWGQTSPARTFLRDAHSVEELHDALTSVGHRGAIARGLGRSYGDAAQNSGGSTIRFTDRSFSFDADCGVVTASAGATFDDIMTQIIPHGWFVPVTAGTRQITVGGAIAADIHGKNHHRDGSFGNFVQSISLLLASGDVVELDRSSHHDLFFATIGGMGLTGIILSATFDLLQVSSAMMSVRTERHGDIDTLMESMLRNDSAFRYSVAWVDGTATGKHLGRGVITHGDHASSDEVRSNHKRSSDYRSPTTIGIPRFVGAARSVRRSTSLLFSELWYRKAPKLREGQLVSIPSFFHPLDGVGHWNRLYGKSGFVQHQCVVPLDRDDVIRSILHRVSSDRPANVINVLKRFGEGNDAHLSFPQPGWTLTVDLPVTSQLPTMLVDIDEMVLSAGGRHYLAKDATTGSHSIRSGYPRLDEWQHIRHRVDPDQRWQSDLSRRLNLCATPKDSE